MSILAEKIISYLQAQTTHTFPNYGILGGQAVAEAYFRIKNIPINTRIKDIDLFINLKNNRWRNKYPDYTRMRLSRDGYSLGRRDKTRIVEKKIWGRGGSFGDDFVQEPSTSEVIKTENASYRILDTFNIDIINVVEVKYDEFSNVNHVNFLKHTIDEFDINAIQIGVCLRTKRVYMTEHFKQFIETKQVEVVGTKRPARTLCRFLEKSQFYRGAYFNFEQEANFVLSHFVLNDYKKNKKLRGVKFIKEAYDSLSDKNKKLLGNYFNVKFEVFENFDRFHFHVRDKTYYTRRYGQVVEKGIKYIGYKGKEELEKFVNRAIVEEKNVLIVKPPFNYLNPNSMDFNALLRDSGLGSYYCNIINPLLEYAEKREDNTTTKNMRRYRNKVTSKMQKNRFTILASKEIELVKLEPRIRRFKKVIRDNLKFVNSARKRRTPVMKLYRFRGFNQILQNKNTFGLFLRELIEHERFALDYAEFAHHCFKYKFDFTEFFQAKKSFQKACLRHISLTSDVLAYHHLKKTKDLFDIDLYASKIIEIEKSAHNHILGLFEDKTLSIGSIYNPIDEIIQEAERKASYKNTTIEALDEEYLQFKEYEINHINNTNALKNVGNEMRHCVGGYWKSLVSRDKLFFDVYDQYKKRYTLSVDRRVSDEKIYLSMGEMKKKANRHPPKKVVKDINEFISILEEKMQTELNSEITKAPTNNKLMEECPF